MLTPPTGTVLTFNHPFCLRDALPPGDFGSLMDEQLIERLSSALPACFDHDLPHRAFA